MQKPLREPIGLKAIPFLKEMASALIRNDRRKSVVQVFLM